MSNSNAPVKALVMAGGTGGHVFPALAVAKVLQGRGVEVCWLGTRRRIEATLVPEAGINICFIDVEGVRGKGLLSLLKAPWLLLKAVWQALAVLRREQPDVVIGFGGFASGPGGLAARLKNIPLVIHEQNAVPGTTNKWLAKMAQRVLMAFPCVLQGSQVGNPVREEIVALPEPQQRLQDRESQSLNLLVLGGSLGALAINQLVPQVVAQLPQALQPNIWHQTGKGHEQSTSDAYDAASLNAKVEPFIADMAAAYGWADLVICRAGALTLSLIPAAGLASVLVPYPYAIDDHQTKNGQWLVDNQAAWLIQQSELDTETLVELLTGLAGEREKLLFMAERARALALPNAANDVAAMSLELING